MLAMLLLIRSAVNYWQQAFLWEAALNLACRIRAYVFDRVLKRDLGFFEGSGVVSTGDIAYRVTAEAADVADTVYALLNVSISYFVSLSLYLSIALSFLFFIHENLNYNDSASIKFIGFSLYFRLLDVLELSSFI